ncbi:MAG: tetratricopeptide repeat protein [Candidatus Omnitrophica bacterium]|nr:tetratricopeptide repeat protein [Candidatus Omnitrophota bacterium]
MSIEFYRKLSWIAGFMAIGILFGLISFCATIEIKDLDLWLHIKAGEYIFTHGFVPTTDVFSCTAMGLPWNNHEWLFQVILYLIKTFWGMDGLIYMQAGVVTFTFLLLLLLTYRNDKQLIIIPLLFFSLLIYQTRFTIRPDIFSLLFFVLFIHILSTRLSERWSVWALFGLQLLWVNMHGYFFLGVLLVALGILSEVIKRHVPLPWEWSKEGRLTDEEFARIKWAFLVVVAAACINPQTFKGAFYPLKVMFDVSGDSKIFFQSITELRAPIAWSDIFNTSSNLPYKALIGVSFLSFIFNRRKIDVSALLLWVVILGFSLSAVRNMAYFSFVAYLVVMINAQQLKFSEMLPVRFTHESFMYITGAMAKILLIVGLMNFGSDMSTRGYYDFDRYERKSEFLGIDQRMFPHKAVDFLIANGITGNFFNDFNSGAFLIGRAFPQIHVYMDGRTELHGPELFKTYRKIWEDADEKEFDKAVKTFNLTGVFVNTAYAEAPDDFLKMIAKKQGWTPVYFDYDAVIFLKNVPMNALAIKKFAIDLKDWKSVGLDLRRLGPAPVFPYRFINRAITLRGMGFDDAALREADAEIEVYPSAVGAYRVKGGVWLNRKEYDKAFQAYRMGVSYATDDNRMRFKMAEAYLGLGEIEYARKEGEKLIERAPDSPDGYFIVARALAKNGQYEKSYDILLEALERKPKQSEQTLSVGAICLEAKAYDWAEKIFKQAVQHFDASAVSRERLGDLYSAEGKMDEALKEWEKGLSMKPDNDDLKKKIEKAKQGATGGKS